MSLFKVVMQWLLLSSLGLTVFYLHLISVRNNFNRETNFNQLIITEFPSLPDMGRFPGVEEYTRYVSSHLKLKTIADAAALKPEFGPVLNDVNFRYSINPITNQCRDTNLFVVVISAPGNVLHRNSIRRTWASDLDGIKSAKYAFLIGSSNRDKVQNSIRNESSIYGDLIQVEMLDTYMNLTLKSVALLHWTFHFCSGAQLILKCDDDIYINVRNLATVIQHLPPKSPTVYGTPVSNLKPMRSSPSQPADDSDKWIVSRQLWPWSTYPTYVSGGCYIIDSSAIGPLLAAAQTTPYFPFEDLYVNGLCARKAEVQVLASDLMLGSIVDVLEDLLDEESWMVANFVTWLTSSADEMVASHLATKLYFNQDHRWTNNSLFNWTRISIE